MWTEDRYEEYVAHMEATYPKMFVKPYGGIAIGAGWYHIIQSLCNNIQSHIDWNNTRAEMHPDLCYKPVPQVIITQIKEKFGGLRFYYDGGNDTISGMVAMAETWADSSCETCGDLGTRRSGGWIRTLCDLHEEQYQAKRNNHE